MQKRYRSKVDRLKRFHEQYKMVVLLSCQNANNPPYTMAEHLALSIMIKSDSLVKFISVDPVIEELIENFVSICEE